MNKGIIILIIVVIIIAIYFIYKKVKFHLNSVKVKSNVDGEYYTVRNTPYKQYSADTLATINQRIAKLLKLIQNDRENHIFSSNIQQAIRRYNPKNLIENIDLEDTSYSINKGESVVACIASRDITEKIYNIELLMYVMIHELTHVGCRSIGHGDEFKAFFSYLLGKAADCNCDIWTYTDYAKNPQEYCGMIINSTPI